VSERQLHLEIVLLQHLHGFAQASIIWEFQQPFLDLEEVLQKPVHLKIHYFELIYLKKIEQLKQ
jgi:hypothetical protein